MALAATCAVAPTASNVACAAAGASIVDHRCSRLHATVSGDQDKLLGHPAVLQGAGELSELCQCCCWASMQLSPGSAQVPLLWTVYALVSFREFHVMPADHAARSKGFFELPPSYSLRTLEEAQKHSRQKSLSRCVLGTLHVHPAAFSPDLAASCALWGGSAPVLPGEPAQARAPCVTTAPRAVSPG